LRKRRGRGEKLGGVAVLEVNSAFLFEGERRHGIFFTFVLKNLEKGGGLLFIYLFIIWKFFFVNFVYS
jgi:hypothetical protein